MLNAKPTLPAPAEDKKDAPQDAEELLRENVLVQLQWLFGQLEGTRRRAVSPRDWCKAYKDESGRPTNPFVQQDAQEFLATFADRLSDALKPTPFRNLLPVVLQGELKSQVVCTGECGGVRDAGTQPFVCVSLQVARC